jgi:hypothetical protein
MDRVAPFLGGVVGGWFLTEASDYGQFLASLDPFLNIVGTLSIVVFSGALIYKGAQGLLKK